MCKIRLQSKLLTQGVLLRIPKAYIPAAQIPSPTRRTRRNDPMRVLSTPVQSVQINILWQAGQRTTQPKL